MPTTTSGLGPCRNKCREVLIHDSGVTSRFREVGGTYLWNVLWSEDSWLARALLGSWGQSNWVRATQQGLNKRAAILLCLQHLITLSSHTPPLWSPLKSTSPNTLGLFVSQWEHSEVRAEEISLSPPPFPEVCLLPGTIWNRSPQLHLKITGGEGGRGQGKYYIHGLR